MKVVFVALVVFLLIGAGIIYAVIDHSKRYRFLDFLSFHHWKAGLEIIAEVEKAGQSFAKRGTIYVYLNALEDEGLIESRLCQADIEKGRTPRREYRRTSKRDPRETSRNTEVSGQQLVRPA